MLRPARRSVVLALAAAALGLSACGSEEQGGIPPEHADALLAQLDEIQQAISEDDCSSAQTDISQLTGAVNALPAEVGLETKDALRELTANLSELTAEQCEEPDTGGTGETGAQPPPAEETEEPAVVEAPEEPPPEDVEEQSSDEETGVPGSSDNGPPGPGGNPNDDGSSGGIGGD